MLAAMSDSQRPKLAAPRGIRPPPMPTLFVLLMVGVFVLAYLTTRRDAPPQPGPPQTTSR
jgi:hypothetical protein